MEALIRERAAILSEAIKTPIDVSHLPYTIVPETGNAASFIDHTILSCDAKPCDVAKICDEAKKYHFASVCVNGCYAKQCIKALESCDSKVCCVIGFPLGAMTTGAKVAETQELVSMGVDEIDMVINCGHLKAGEYLAVYDDIRAIAGVCHNEFLNGKHVCLKVIIEATCLETDQLIVDACLLSKAAGADYVKTSTGMHKNGGAKAEHVKLMKMCVGDALKVKAAGGIRDYAKQCDMIKNGASRIGASAGISIVADEEKSKN